MMYCKLTLCVLFFLLSTATKSQSVHPLILNTGGNSVGNFSNYLEFSIGESASIGFFSSGGYILNTGVLQPLNNLVTGPIELGPAGFGNQLSIGPNPTSNRIHIKTLFNQAGTITFMITDSKAAILYTNEVGTVSGNYEKEFYLQHYPAGVYYIQVYFKPPNSVAKSAIYKIIKNNNSY